MKKRYELISDDKLQKLLIENIPASFRTGFSDRVMLRIQSVNNKLSDWELFVDTLSYQFKRFALTGFLVIVFMISYNIISKDEITFAKALDIPDYTLEDAFDPIASYSWSKE